MKSSGSSCSVTYGQKEYEEIVLNSSADKTSSHEEGRSNYPNTVHVSSLEDEEEPCKESFDPCLEKEVLKTVPCASVFEKYVSSKIVLTQGSKGVRPKSHSVCTIVIHDTNVLDTSFLGTFQQCSPLYEKNVNTETFVEIGSSDEELGRALELTLLNMYEGEKCQVLLHSSKRTKKLRDEIVLPVPCLRCTISLKQIQKPSGLINTHATYFLSLLRASDETKCHIAVSEKLRGVELFKQGRHVDAFHRFATGVKILLTSDWFLLEGTAEKNSNLSILYSTLCSNMAECQLKENNLSLAISLCKKALVCNPSNVKALYRQALAAWNLGDVDQSALSLKHLLELDPNNIAAKQLEKEVQVKMKSYEVQYANMMKRIFQY